MTLIGLNSEAVFSSNGVSITSSHAHTSRQYYRHVQQMQQQIQIPHQHSLSRLEVLPCHFRLCLGASSAPLTLSLMSGCQQCTPQCDHHTLSDRDSLRLVSTHVYNQNIRRCCNHTHQPLQHKEGMLATCKGNTQCTMPANLKQHPGWVPTSFYYQLSAALRDANLNLLGMGCSSSPHSYDSQLCHM